MIVKKLKTSSFWWPLIATVIVLLGMVVIGQDSSISSQRQLFAEEGEPTPEQRRVASEAINERQNALLEKLKPDNLDEEAVKVLRKEAEAIRALLEQPEIPYQAPAELLAQTESSVVRIESDKSSGSGVLLPIEGGGGYLVVTAKHIIESLSKDAVVRVFNSEGERIATYPLALNLLNVSAKSTVDYATDLAVSIIITDKEFPTAQLVPKDFQLQNYQLSLIGCASAVGGKPVSRKCMALQEGDEFDLSPDWKAFLTRTGFLHSLFPITPVSKPGDSGGGLFVFDPKTGETLLGGHLPW